VSSFDNGASGGNGVWLVSYKSAVAEASIDPVLGNVLDTYWAEYANNIAAMQQQERASARGRSSQRSSSRKAPNLGQTTSSNRWKHTAAHELDGLRFLEIVSKLCSSKTSLPSDVYEKVLRILDNHGDHHHLTNLSHEAYLCLARLTAHFPCATLSADLLNSVDSSQDGKKHLIVDPKAWTPLSLHRKLDSLEEEEENAKHDGNRQASGDENLTRRSARNRGAAWKTYTEKIEKLLDLFKSIEEYQYQDNAPAGPREEREKEDLFSARAGIVLGFKYFTQIMADDLAARVGVSTHYHLFVSKEGNLKYESLLPQLKHLLQSSVLCQLIRLTHQTVDGGNDMMSLKTFVHKVVQVKLLAAKCMKGELGPANLEDHVVMAPQLCREIYSVCKRIITLICTLFSEMERCVDFSGMSYGHVENDRKILDTWMADLFFNCHVMQSTWDRNLFLQMFESPKYKLRFLGELFARYIGKQASVEDHLVTLKHAVIQKDSLCLAPVVDEEEVLEYIKLHAKNTITCLELVDTVALVVVHIYQAKLRMREKEMMSNRERRRQRGGGDPSQADADACASCSPSSSPAKMLGSFTQVVACVREHARAKATVATTTTGAGAAGNNNQMNMKMKVKGSVFQFSQFALAQLALCHGVLQKAAETTA
jgi:hypothetical protein